MCGRSPKALLLSVTDSPLEFTFWSDDDLGSQLTRPKKHHQLPLFEGTKANKCLSTVGLDMFYLCICLLKCSSLKAVLFHYVSLFHQPLSFIAWKSQKSMKNTHCLPASMTTCPCLARTLWSAGSHSLAELQNSWSQRPAKKTTQNAKKPCKISKQIGLWKWKHKRKLLQTVIHGHTKVSQVLSIQFHGTQILFKNVAQILQESRNTRTSKVLKPPKLATSQLPAHRDKQPPDDGMHHLSRVRRSSQSFFHSHWVVMGFKTLSIQKFKLSFEHLQTTFITL